MKKLLYLKNSRIEIYVKPGAEVNNILYVLAAETVELEPMDGICIAMVYPFDWTAYMTPWVHEGDIGGETGRGAEYAKDFFFEVVSPVERSLTANIKHRGIAGYSLGGLMALYMSVKLPGFDFVGSVSGSLWYTGAVEYFIGSRTKEEIRSAYFSLGNKEKNTKDPERSHVEDNTNLIVSALSRDIEVFYESNPGGHFTQIPERIKKCIAYYLGRI